MKKQIIKPIYVGLMRMITLNFKLWGKPTELGWNVVERKGEHNGLV